MTKPLPTADEIGRDLQLARLGADMGAAGCKRIAAAYDTMVEQLNRKDEALAQLLDDMGEDGLCVCQQAKDEARQALGRSA